MKVKIKLIKYKGQPPEEFLEASFDQNGGTIGRLPEKLKNHLTLHDPQKFISRRHATIKYERGIVYLTDSSVDGTDILNKKLRVRQDTVALTDGDKLKIGDYELLVQIQLNNELEPMVYPPEVFNQKDEPLSDFERKKKTFEVPLKETSGQAGSGFLLSEKIIDTEPLEPKNLIEQFEDSQLHDSFAPPDIMEEDDNSQKIPEDFNFEDLIADVNKSKSDTEPARTDVFETLDKHSPLQESETGHKELFEMIRQQAYCEMVNAFFEGAGVKDTNFFQLEDTAELMKTVGAVFREMVDGLIAVLQGRSELRAQFRVPATLLKPANNNPLKYYRIVDDAIKQLLTKKMAGFVDAIDAVREGFKDIKGHQLAMAAGIQAAIIELIGRFDPQHFAKQFEEGVVFQRKTKNWDAYQQGYTEIANQALENFFGESFIRAYEEQIRKLS